jgi:uncharacterized protein (DUF2147 family)
MRSIFIFFLSLLAILMSTTTFALHKKSSINELSPVGYWLTISDEKVEGRDVAQSVVKIYQDPTSPDQLKGKIIVPFVKVKNGKKEIPDAICDVCNGNLKNKPIVGLPIISHLEKVSDKDGEKGPVYKYGQVIDPTNGKSYSLKLWTENNGQELKLRAYVLFFYRTQTWYRVSKADALRYQKDCGFIQGGLRYKYTDKGGKINSPELWSICSNILK